MMEKFDFMLELHMQLELICGLETLSKIVQCSSLSAA